ncbi:MAG: radical SAM protein, partial [Abditibacteriota bacterium]|nr:radical SAM protein [Abditibacteriota bacterium]
SSFGITLSGGEPLMQPAAAFALLEEFGGREGDTCIETCGFCSPEIFGELRRRCRFVYMDLKLADDEEHKKYTGRSNRPIIENLAQLRGSGADYMLRVPLVPGITDTDENLRGLSRLAGSSPVELLEYNTLAGAKYEGVGRKYSLGKGRSRSAEEAAAFFEEPVIRR